MKTTASPRMSPDPRTDQSPIKTRPAVTSQNSAQRPEICNMVTRSVLMENNIHDVVTKRALEASTDACSPENAPRSLHVLALAKCIPLIQFHCMVCGTRGQVITTKPAPLLLNSEVLTALSPQVPTLGALPQHIEPHTLIVRYVLSAGGLFQAVLLIYLRQQIS